MVVYKSIFDPTFWNHSSPSFESQHHIFNLFNLVGRSPAEEELSPSWPKVVTPELVTPPVNNMVGEVEDSTMVTLITSSTTPNPGGSDLTFLILTVLTALCKEKGSTDTACVRARSQLQSLSLARVDVGEEDPADPYDAGALQHLLVSLINDQSAVNEREREGRQNVQGFSWSVFLQAVKGIGRFVKSVSNPGDVVELLEEWLRRPAQKTVNPEQLKVYFDLFAMEALYALQHDVKLLEVSLFVLIGTLLALVVLLGIGWTIMCIRACRKDKKVAKVKRQRSDADILLRNLQHSRRRQIMESQF